MLWQVPHVGCDNRPAQHSIWFVVLRLFPSSKPDVEIAIVGTAYDKTGKRPFIPGANRQYLIVEVAVTNHSDQPVDFAPVVQTWVSERSGHNWDMTPAPLEKPFAAGSLKPGATRVGQLSYNVPQNSSHLTFHYTLGSKQTNQSIDL